MSSTVLQRILHPIDRPARASSALARQSPLVPLGLTAAGVGAAAIACFGAGLLAGAPLVAMERVGLAALEAMLLVAPALLVGVVYAELRVSAGALVAASAIGAFTAGLVALCLAPLVVFVGLTDRSGLAGQVALLLIPFACVATHAATVARVIFAHDPRARARLAARALVVTELLVFLAAVRVSGAASLV